MSIRPAHVAVAAAAVAAFLLGLLVRPSLATATAPLAPPPSSPVAALPTDDGAPADAEPAAAGEAGLEADLAPRAITMEPEPSWEPEPTPADLDDPFGASSEARRGGFSIVGDASWPEYPWPEPQMISARPESQFQGGELLEPEPADREGHREPRRPPPPGGRGGGGGGAMRGGGGHAGPRGGASGGGASNGGGGGGGCH